MKACIPHHTLCLIIGIILVNSGIESPLSFQTLGPEYQVNTTSVDEQFVGDIQADVGGNYVIVWSSTNQDGDGNGVFGQRYDSLENPIGTEFQINTYTSYDQYAPRLAVEPAGSFVVVWISEAQDGSWHGVYGQRFDVSGNSAGPEFQVNTTTEGDQGMVDVEADPFGNFVVTWSGWITPGDPGQISSQRYTSSGDRIGTEFQLNSYPDGCSDPSIAMDQLGNFATTWRNAQRDGDGSAIFMRRFDNQGVPAGIEYQVNAYALGNQEQAACAIGTSGTVIVVWESQTSQDGDGAGIFGQLYDSNGNPLGSEFQVNSYTIGSQAHPSVAMDECDNFLVVWMSANQDGSGNGVYGQAFDRSGLKVGTEFRINAYTNDNQWFPVVTAVGCGKYHAAWDSKGQDAPASSGVFARSITIDDLTVPVEDTSWGGIKALYGE